MMELLFWLLLVPNAIIFCVVFYNYLTAPRLKNDKTSSEKSSEHISILIPARNEEQNIASCLNHVCCQTHHNLEIIVLDDQSTDKTADIVGAFSQKDSRVKLIAGTSLPEGWLGKNWACHNLSLKATAEKLLFIDADVKLTEDAVTIALNIMRKEKANMLSVFPTQLIENLGTRLITPLMNWILLSFLPLRKVFTSPSQSFTAANGQFILINRNDYISIGGHEKVKAKVVEDMELARAIKQYGKKIITLVGDSTVDCKMYSNYADAYNGFSKNFFLGFNMNYVVFFFVLLLLHVVFLLPFVLVFINAEFVLVILLVLASRVLIALISKQKIVLEVILHPIQMIILLIVGINSLIVTRKKKAEWKGRII
ncbi:MAG: Glycosyltransferase [Ignavibacteria bacterium]|nr:MAG: Glycosyltransferase [Ignavibacteria bacterium]KAF0155687.1 MAG: Glycosyltransferase [Ignavibacteria bacterium]